MSLLHHIETLVSALCHKRVKIGDENGLVKTNGNST